MFGKAVNSNMLLIGAKMQEYRKKQGLSQEEFAARVGVTRQAVSKWETDKAYPDLDKLVAICDILQISITGLVYGENVSASETPAGQAPEMETKRAAVEQKPEIKEAFVGQAPEMPEIAAGKARGKGGYLRLWIMLVLTGGLFLFCGVLLATTLAHNAWIKEDALAKRVRVERVYQQYTKADVSFLDDVSRRVVQTVWLDVNGIREGDYLFCYIDEAQKGIYYEYRAPTLIVLGVAELVFLAMLLMCLAEVRHFAGKNSGHIPVEEAKEKERFIPANEVKEKEKSAPAGETRESGQ